MHADQAIKSSSSCQAFLGELMPEDPNDEPTLRLLQVKPSAYVVAEIPRSGVIFERIV
jgi:hypothetical protein